MRALWCRRQRAFNDLTLDGSANVVWELFDPLVVEGTLDVTSGVLIQQSWNVEAESVVVGPDGSWRSSHAGSVTLGAGGVENAGAIVFLGDDSGSGIDEIEILSTDDGVQRPWSGAGTFNIAGARAGGSVCILMILAAFVASASRRSPGAVS